MNWFYEGIAAAVWQLAALAVCVIIAAASMWSCEYLNISPGYAILAFYVTVLVSVNLFFSWHKFEAIEIVVSPEDE